MENEYLFRLALVAGFALFVPIAGYYRLKAHGTGEKLDRSQEGRALFFGIRGLAAVTVGALTLYIIDPSLMSWSAVNLPFSTRAVGIAMGPLAGLLWIYTFHHLGMNLTDTVVTRERAFLVKSGPYRYVRHPFYVSFFLIAIANGLVTANWFILIGGLAMFLLLYRRTAIEENKLIEKFGDEYLDYMKSTGRFFPKILAGS